MYCFGCMQYLCISLVRDLSSWIWTNTMITTGDNSVLMSFVADRCKHVFNQIIQE